MIALSDLLERLQKVRRSSNGYTALCPGHDDREASLSISIKTTGVILMCCHAGCSFEVITRALGGWTRRDRAAPAPIVSFPEERARGPRATPGACDAAYSYILEELTLSAEHAVQLLDRGLDEETIARNLYATAPDRERLTDLATEASKRVNVTGIPGFVFICENRWGLVAEENDLLIPVRDSQFRIIALRRRTNDPERRYLWCSAKTSPSGSPPHHAAPWNVKFRPVLYITEGELKADVVAALTTFTTIGLPGANSIPPGFGTTLRDAYPSIRSAFIAYDSDFRHKEGVRAGRTRLTASLQAAGFVVRFIEWDEADGKGLDDVLVRALA